MKKKIRFLLPAILCCLLVCGTAAGSHYAQGVSLMERALAAEEAYQSAGVVSAEELSQALEGEEALSTKEILDAAEQVRRSASPELEPHFTGSLEERFSQNCQEGLEAPLEWGFSVDRGFTNPKLLGWKSLSSTEVQVRFRADTWLSTIYSYLLEGAPRYTVEVLFRPNEAGGRPVEGGLARHGPAVCAGQLPAHPRGLRFLSGGAGLCEQPGRPGVGPVCPVSRESIEKGSGFRSLFCAYFLVTGLPALPAPKPCTPWPAG